MYFTNEWSMCMANYDAQKFIFFSAKVDENEFSYHFLVWHLRYWSRGELLSTKRVQ